jgi:hypothetical protein
LWLLSWNSQTSLQMVLTGPLIALKAAPVTDTAGKVAGCHKTGLVQVLTAKLQIL